MGKSLTKRKKKWIERTVDNDRSYKAIVYNRAVGCVFFLLLQVAVSVWLLMRTEFGLALQGVVGILSVLTVIYLAGRNRRYPTRTLWIILLLTAPIVGVPLYLLYGDGKPTMLMERRYRNACKRLEQCSGAKSAPSRGVVASRGGSLFTDTTSARVALSLETVSPSKENSVCRVLANLGFPSYTDGKVTYYPTGKELFAAMKESVRTAKRYIFAEYFILSGGKMWSELLALLLQRAEAGVEIKIIYDDMGSMFSLPKDYALYLESLHPNIQCLSFNKVYPIFTARYNHRDHRKILAVDGRVAFTGGVNIADEYVGAKKRFGYWKDVGIQVSGEAATALARTFLETWIAFKEPNLDPTPYLKRSPDGKPSAENNAKKNESFAPTDVPVKGSLIVPCADSPLDELRLSEAVFLETINRADKRLYIATPYLVLDETLRGALSLAAARGVDVRIITPGIPDKKAVYRLTRANYAPLLRAGVRIYEYTPGFLHAKITLSDDGGIVGTTNYDYRSLYLHFENMVYFQGEELEDVEKDFAEMFLVSKERTLCNIKRGLVGRVADTVLRLFEPLL